ncbi:MAG TPA: ABC transporter permease [Acidimicrobiales bacterium]|nr:ABC transporter permease [Acidimicrobiales bacterium]
MHFLGQVVAWFTTASHWQGDGGVLHRLGEHLVMSAAATATAVVLALPVGVVLGHKRRGGLAAVNVSNVGRAVPSFALLVFGAQVFGVGPLPAYLALVALAIPPIVTNSYTGVRQVDPDVVEAARGMGMGEARILGRVELPVAMPLVMAGVRTAGVQVVATATLAAVVAWGGLGRYIVDGLAQGDQVQLFAGALLVAGLAMAVEVGLGVLQRVLTPAGLRLRPRAQRRVSYLPGAAAAPEAT